MGWWGTSGKTNSTGGILYLPDVQLLSCCCSFPVTLLHVFFSFWSFLFVSEGRPVLNEVPVKPFFPFIYRQWHNMESQIYSAQLMFCNLCCSPCPYRPVLALWGFGWDCNDFIQKLNRKQFADDWWTIITFEHTVSLNVISKHGHSYCMHLMYIGWLYNIKGLETY